MEKGGKIDGWVGSHANTKRKSKIYFSLKTKALLEITKQHKVKSQKNFDAEFFIKKHLN